MGGGTGWFSTHPHQEKAFGKEGNHDNPLSPPPRRDPTLMVPVEFVVLYQKKKTNCAVIA